MYPRKLMQDSVKNRLSKFKFLTYWDYYDILQLIAVEW